jgi:ketosteroid isomerase-like protein
VSANLDLVRSIYAAHGRGDFSSARWADPEIEFVIADGPSPSVWKGAAGMAEGFRIFVSAWEDLRVEAEEFRELDGERILVLTRLTGRGKASEMELGQMGWKGGADLFHSRGGKVTRFVLYFDRDHAFADLGLKEEAMSQENVDLVRSLYAAWNTGDYRRALALIDPEIEVESVAGSISAGTYRGHAGLSQLLEEFWSQFDDRRSEVKEYIPTGDDVVTSVLHYGRGKKSGIEVEMYHWHQWTLRDGKVVRWRLFSDRREAFEAAGLAE